MVPHPRWKTRLVLRFRERVSWSTEGADGPYLVAPPLCRLCLAHVPPVVRDALHGLLGDGRTEEELAEELSRQDGAWSVATLLVLLRRLEQLRLLAYAVRDESGVLASLHPISPWFELRPVALEARRPYVLSRFAYQRRVGQGMVLESPRCHAWLRLEAPAAAALCLALARPSTDESLASETGRAPELIEAFLGLLLSAGLLLPADDSGRTEEEHAPQLAPWSFHDLLFHARSRLGRHAEPMGKTFPFRERFPAPPALRAPAKLMAAPIALHRPDLDALRAADPPFTAVLEDRRSLRLQGTEPLSLESLGEFLFRVARVRERPAGTPAGYEITSRPYPSGGACYELELYLAVDRCEGLASGLYHYEPEGHLLCLRSERTPAVEALLAGAAASTASPRLPQVLLCLASRFQRVSWSYEGIGYAITLKNAGVLYQTCYLVATAMGLACCGVGLGDSDLFASAAGTDYYAETTVGELLLGSRGEGDGAALPPPSSPLRKERSDDCAPSH